MEAWVKLFAREWSWTSNLHDWTCTSVIALTIWASRADVLDDAMHSFTRHQHVKYEIVVMLVCITFRVILAIFQDFGPRWSWYDSTTTPSNEVTSLSCNERHKPLSFLSRSCIEYYVNYLLSKSQCHWVNYSSSVIVGSSPRAVGRIKVSVTRDLDFPLFLFIMLMHSIMYSLALNGSERLHFVGVSNA